MSTAEATLFSTMGGAIPPLP